MSDREVIDATVRAARQERCTTVELLAFLGELDERRLYLGEGCPSLFAYCTQVLRLSEHAAYHRIEAARAARTFPVILDFLAEGVVTLTTIALLRPHLTEPNHRELLEAARHRSKREVERQLACLAPRPDVDSLVRRLPAQSGTATDASNPSSFLDAGVTLSSSVLSEDRVPTPTSTMAPSPASTSASPRAIARPLATDRYLLRVTLSQEAYDALQRARDLMRHTVPDGDPAEIVERSLTLLVEHLEKKKFAKREDPSSPRRSNQVKVRSVTAPVGSDARPDPPIQAAHSRYIPAPVKRTVWERDGGRCAFVGAQGRCRETSQLEFHHIRPYALGGSADATNIGLRCRAHNRHESELRFGPSEPREVDRKRRSESAP